MPDAIPLTRRHCLALIAAPALIGAAPSDGLRPPAPDLTFAGQAEVVGIDDAGTLVLETGERARLLALRLPQPGDLPPDADAAERRRQETLARQSLEGLRRAVVGRPVALWTTAVVRDRHGRLLVHATLTGEPEAPWVQAALVARGLARVATLPGAAIGAAALLRLEAIARVNERGLWRDPLYRPRAPLETWPWLGTFQIVRGTVQATAKVGSRVYLNFGEDWRRDFTVMVERPHRKGMKTAALLDLRRQFIQVRGWLFPTNGPMIALDHPEALETRVHLASPTARDET